MRYPGATRRDCWSRPAFMPVPQVRPDVQPPAAHQLSPHDTPADPQQDIYHHSHQPGAAHGEPPGSALSIECMGRRWPGPWCAHTTARASHALCCACAGPLLLPGAGLCGQHAVLAGGQGHRGGRQPVLRGRAALPSPSLRHAARAESSLAPCCSGGGGPLVPAVLVRHGPWHAQVIFYSILYQLLGAIPEMHLLVGRLR